MLDFGVPPIVQVTGGSMEPTLPRGSRVNIVPLEGAPPLESVLLFRGSSGDLVDRLVWSAWLRGELLRLHKGDAPGGVGLVAAARAIGRVYGRPVREPADGAASASPGPTLRAYRRAQLGCRASVVLRRLADRSGLAGWLPRAFAEPLKASSLRSTPRALVFSRTDASDSELPNGEPSTTHQPSAG